MGKGPRFWKLNETDKKHLSRLEMIVDALAEFGLSKNEVRVYLYLARFGMGKARDVSDGLSLHRTETYKILRELEKKGLVSSVFEKPLRFIATPFEKALNNLIEAKKHEIRQLEGRKGDIMDVWSSLPESQRESEEMEIFQILEGEEQIEVKSNEILGETERELLVVAPEADLFRLHHSDLIDRLGEISKTGVNVQLLTDSSPRSRYIAEKMRLKNVRFLRSPEDLTFYMISDGKQLLFSVRKNNKAAENGRRNKRDRPSALWTNYDVFIKTLKTLFSELWNTGRSPHDGAETGSSESGWKPDRVPAAAIRHLARPKPSSAPSPPHAIA